MPTAFPGIEYGRISSYYYNPHRLEMVIFFNGERVSENKSALFYIPGTGSQVKNPAISYMAASHLKLLFDAQQGETHVVTLNHRLCPDVYWPTPLDDVNGMIIDYIGKYRPTSISVAGYSSGGLIATEAVIALRKKGIEVKQLILHAPETDLTREFRNMHDPRATDEHRSYLPTEYQKNGLAALDEHNQHSERDTLLKASTMDQYVSTMFPHTPNAKLQDLRNYSILWRKEQWGSLLQGVSVTILTGEHDYFLPENQIFLAMLNELKISAAFVLFAGKSHDVFWKSLFSLYFSLIPTKSPANRITISTKDADDIAENESRIKELKDELDHLSGNEEKMQKQTDIKSACLRLSKLTSHFFREPVINDNQQAAAAAEGEAKNMRH